MARGDWFTAVFNLNKKIRQRAHARMHESKEERQERLKAKYENEAAVKKMKEYEAAKARGDYAAAVAARNEAYRLQVESNRYADKYGDAWREESVVNAPIFKDPGAAADENAKAFESSSEPEDAVEEAQGGGEVGGNDEPDAVVDPEGEDQIDPNTLRGRNFRELEKNLAARDMGIKIDARHQVAIITNKSGRAIGKIPLRKDVVEKLGVDKKSRGKAAHFDFYGGAGSIRGREAGHFGMFGRENLNLSRMNTQFRPGAIDRKGMSEEFYLVDSFIKHMRNELRDAQQKGRIVSLSDVRHWVGLEKKNGDSSHIPVQFLQQVLDVANIPEKEWQENKALQISMAQSVAAVVKQKSLAQIKGGSSSIRDWGDVLVPDTKRGFVKLKDRNPRTAPKMFDVQFSPGLNKALQQGSYEEAKRVYREERMQYLQDQLAPGIAEDFNAKGFSGGQERQQEVAGAVAGGGAVGGGAVGGRGYGGAGYGGVEPDYRGVQDTREPVYETNTGTGVGKQTETTAEIRREAQRAQEDYSAAGFVREDDTPYPADIFRYKPVSQDAERLGIPDKPEIDFELLRDLSPEKQKRIMNEYNNMNKVWADNANNALLLNDALYLRQQRETAYKNAQSRAEVGVAGDKLQKKAIKKWEALIETGKKDWEKARRQEKEYEERGHYGAKDIYDAIRGTRGSAIPKIDFSGMRQRRLEALGNLLDRGV